METWSASLFYFLRSSVSSTMIFLYGALCQKILCTDYNDPPALAVPSMLTGIRPELIIYSIALNHTFFNRRFSSVTVLFNVVKSKEYIVWKRRTPTAVARGIGAPHSGAVVCQGLEKMYTDLSWRILSHFKMACVWKQVPSHQYAGFIFIEMVPSGKIGALWWKIPKM